MNQAAKAPVRFEIEATVIRADGTIQELGTIGSTSWRFKPWKQWAANTRIRKANKEAGH